MSWISVKAGLPDELVSCLIVHDTEILIAWYDKLDNRWQDEDHTLYSERVTHWMLLPTLPGGKK